MSPAPRLLVLAALLLAPGMVLAHAVNFAVAFLRVTGNDVQMTLTITSSDVDRAGGVNVTDHGSGMVDPGKLAAVETRLQRYFAERTTVTAAGTPCAAAGPPLISADSDGGIAVQMNFVCPRGDDIVYRSTAMLDIDAAARQSVQLMRGMIADEIAILDAARSAVALTRAAADASDRRAEAPVLVPTPPPAAGVPVIALPAPAVAVPPLPAAALVPPASRWEIARRYLELGVEHIFIGFDHIAFLAAILLWARRLGTVVKIVTAFTVAHSVTLTLAALDMVVVPARLVEPAIAASIILVAAENFLSRDVDRRWVWTGALGLVHGFGFAGVLTEAGLPQQSLVPALLAFNIGVELGQLVIVAGLLALLLALDRVTSAGAPARRPAVVYSASACIAAVGLWWFLERVT
jgi:hydrogenase/urease accessory protein HupE